MKVIDLVKREDPTSDALLFACGKCGSVYSPRMFFEPDAIAGARKLADACCTPLVCECGVTIVTKGPLSCGACTNKNAQEREEARLAKATRFTVQTVPESPVLYDDTFYSDIDELLESLGDIDFDEDDFPLVAWICDQKTPQLDADRIIEDFSENLELSEDCELDSIVNDLDGFRELVNAWNAKQEPKLWMPCDDRCVLIQYADLKTEAPDAAEHVPSSTPVAAPEE